jgi:hypothetical protein
MSSCKITKDEFVSYIDNLRVEYSLTLTLSRFGIQLDALSYRKSTDIIRKNLFGDAWISTIDWWLYDAPNGISGDCYTDSNRVWFSTEGGETVVVISTASDLYDYLTTYVRL